MSPLLRFSGKRTSPCDSAVIAGRRAIGAHCERGHIQEAIERAVSPEFQASLNGMANPYGDGHAAARIVAKLKLVEIGDKLLRKIFHDDGVVQ